MDVIYSNCAPNFLYVDEYHFSRRWVYKEDRLPYSMLRYICRGTARFEVNGEAFEVKQDDIFYIPQGSSLYCAATSDLVFISIRFLTSICLPETDMLRRLWGITPLCRSSKKEEYRLYFERIYRAALSDRVYKHLEIRGCLNLLCAALAEEVFAERRNSGAGGVRAEAEFGETAADATGGIGTNSVGGRRAERRSAPAGCFCEREATKRSPLLAEDGTDGDGARFDLAALKRRAVSSHIYNDPRIRVLIDYLTLHPEVNLSRREMCEMCDVSESTLRRLFKQHTGKTIADFIRDNKMMYAAHLLITTRRPISEIGYSVGFESPGYFGKSFREVFGVSPRQYRTQSDCG